MFFNPNSLFILGYDIAKNFDFALAPVKISGEENKKNFLENWAWMRENFLEFPFITGKHQEKFEYFINLGLERGA